MISIYDCLIAPVMTEKSMNKGEGVYTFRVNPSATKFDVRRAVEEIFKVKVARVNILNRTGKKKVFRGRFGRTEAKKFAIVKLSEGSIKFEGGL